MSVENRILNFQLFVSQRLREIKQTAEEEIAIEE